MADRGRVLVTGAAGGVARMLLPGLAEHDDLVEYDEVRLTDLLPDPDGHHTWVGDLTDPAFISEVTDGIDAIVHLAANPSPNATWDGLLSPNVVATRNILASGVPRIVLASSAHAMGQYVASGHTPVEPDWPPAPCCTYGATKAFAEALGRSTSYRADTTVVALRLGATVPAPPDSSALTGWLGADDLQQLVRRALTADVTFAVCHGMSANTRTEWDVRNDIGYRPSLDSEAFADTVPDDGGWTVCLR